MPRKPAGVVALLLCGDDRAITSVEYGIVATFLCLALLGIFTRFGAVVTAMFNRASGGI